MTFSEGLEKDRERLTGELRRAGTPERALSVLTDEMERLLLTRNEGENSERQRTAAAAMAATAQSCFGFLDTSGEIKVWESGKKERGFRISAAAIVCFALGCGLIAAACVLLLRHAPAAWTAAIPAVGGVILAAAGSITTREQLSTPPERKTEVLTDWDKVCRTLYAAALVMDRNLDESASLERWEAREQKEDGSPMTRDELELMGSLLEAACSGDGDFALDRLSKLRHYLHGKGIEIVEYSPETAALFDVMPSTETATLRPALTTEGRTLLRGLAAGGN